MPTAIDLFAGLGGWSTGARAAGVQVLWAANHWPVAVEWHSANHPDIVFHSQPFSPQVLVSGGDIRGQLSIRDIRREVVFRVQPSTCRQPGVSCPIVAAGTLNRHDFGMHAYRWSLRDEVSFRFQLEFADE